MPNPDKPPVVGHLLTSLCVGGIERFVLNLHQEVSKTGISFVVYSWNGVDPWRDAFERQGIRVVPLGGANRVRRPLDLWKGGKAWLGLRAALARDRVDILHTHDFLPSLVGRTASLSAGIPRRVVTLHNLYDWWPEWAFRVNRVLAHRTDAITCVSESVRQYFLRRERLPPSRYRTILNGVDETRFHPDPARRDEIRAQVGIGPGEILVGSLGSITTRKAQHLLVPAVAELRSRGVPLQVRIWGASQGSPQQAERELLDLIASHGLEDHFRILPPRPDVELLYNAMDIHCMTSIAEGLSLASIEALQCGTVCVYSDIGPFREVIEDGATGFLFRSGDSGSLSAVLAKVVADLPDLQALQQRASERARRDFGLAAMGGAYETLYRDLAAR